jgi:hypothetical protein
MADQSIDDLNPTGSSAQDEKTSTSDEPRGLATEEIDDREDVLDDEQINDRFQATDN